jgi:hypothetical protein
MGTRDERVDAYIAHAPEFARPILAHLRSLVHAACPGASETIKWGFPHFEFNGILCSMAAFKAHCAFGFWHSAMRADAAANAKGDPAMGQFGRITARGDLPKDAALKALIRKAAALNASGVKPARAAPTKAKPPPKIPPDLAAALRRSREARAHFEAMSPSHQREYIDWLIAAKRDATRKKRLATAIEWIAEGKSKEWRYRGS